MSTTGFPHLHLHSEYSLVDSTVRVGPLLEHCAAAGIPAVALTDQMNLFGMVKFYRKALAAGIKPIIGADVRVTTDDEMDRPYTLVLLCQDATGYRSLSELLTRAYLEGQVRGEPQLRREWLDRARCAGLIALSGGAQGDVGRALLNGHEDRARNLVADWQAIFGDRYYLELVRTGRSGEEEVVQACLQIAGAAGAGVVATNDVRFLAREDFFAHEARVCIRDGRVLGDKDRPRHYSEEQYLRSADEMRERFADIPAAIDNALEIAKRCNYELSLGNSVLPAFPVPAGETEGDYLEAQARHGLEVELARKFEDEVIPANERDAVAAPYFARLETELEVIRGMGFPGYFLIVADFIRWARENGVPVGPGR
ncbi:MAG: PHP domain-containing protein, partial [Woeseiaceae bacterium]|nr:PHP domain-containing protein [Woeseiaceae bacterium]